MVSKRIWVVSSRSILPNSCRLSPTKRATWAMLRSPRRARGCQRTRTPPARATIGSLATADVAPVNPSLAPLTISCVIPGDTVIGAGQPCRGASVPGGRGWLMGRVSLCGRTGPGFCPRRLASEDPPVRVLSTARGRPEALTARPQVGWPRRRLSPESPASPLMRSTPNVTIACAVRRYR